MSLNIWVTFMKPASNISELAIEWTSTLFLCNPGKYYYYYERICL